MQVRKEVVFIVYTSFTLKTIHSHFFNEELINRLQIQQLCKYGCNHDKTGVTLIQGQLI